MRDEAEFYLLNLNISSGLPGRRRMPAFVTVASDIDRIIVDESLSEDWCGDGPQLSP